MKRDDRLPHGIGCDTLGLSGGTQPMKMSRMVFALALSVLCTGKSNAQHTVDKLKELKQVSVVIEELDERGKKIGLTDESLNSQALVAVKRDMPRIAVTESAISWLYVRVTVINANASVAASVTVQLHRPVTILTDDGAPLGIATATVWDREVVLAGSNGDMSSRVLEEVSRRITELAAAYYKANS
jgi:hypothetical protein